jgi:hypothetical protein
MTDLLLLETTNDLEILNGNLTIAARNDVNLRQKVSITLQAWQGEWILNTDFGIPYRQNIFGERIISKEEVDAIFIAKIKEKPEVIEVLVFESEFNAAQRKYDITDLQLRTNEGEVVTFSIANPDDITYNFIPPFITSICDE